MLDKKQVGKEGGMKVVKTYYVVIFMLKEPASDIFLSKAGSSKRSTFVIKNDMARFFLPVQRIQECIDVFINGLAFWSECDDMPRLCIPFDVFIDRFGVVVNNVCALLVE